jgi:imidazolonepropionase-like amidohydrolase
MREMGAILLIGIFFLSGRYAAGQARPGTGDGTTVFTNVNVIPMDRERLLKNQTVIVRGGQIAEIGDADKLKAPAGAVQIDGRGKYLIPGLIDMHTHLFSDDKVPNNLATDELAIIVGNGVTTARLMIGTPEQLTLRTKIAQGEMLGPTLFVASPQLTGRAYGQVFNGRVVTSPEDAQRAVRDFKSAGYDFIKITNFITRPVYDAATATAKEVGIRIVGHVDLQVGLDRALAAGQQIEHLDSYMEAVLKDDAPMKESVSDYGVWRKQNWASLDHVDDAKIAAIAKATAKAGVYSCPTLTFFKVSFTIEETDEAIRARPDYRFFPERLRGPLHRAYRSFWTGPPTAERRGRYNEVRNKLVKSIHDAGGKIMAGSDTPELFLLYGWTLHREIKNLAEAGLSPYAALAAATRNPAEYLRQLDTIGTIEKGKRADLVLLDANPLEEISNTEKRTGVMTRGKWIPDAEFKKMLDEMAPRFKDAPPK